MRFGPWYPLGDATMHASPTPGVLQLRRPAGLTTYPGGKSAMVHYEHAPDVRAAAQRLAHELREADLLCRHLIEVPAATDLAAFCEKLLADFVRRFGSAPRLP